MRLTKQFIEEIKPFKTIYCLVSGGYHSTAAALLLKEHGFENVILTHNKTYLVIDIHYFAIITNVIHNFCIAHTFYIVRCRI
jgi:rhodanese-related sulfurtransferase